MSLKTDGADPRVPPDLAEDNDFKAHVVKSDTESEATSVYVPPDPEYPSGILSIQIHQAINVEMQNVKGTYGKTGKYEQGQTNTEGISSKNGLTF
jgi:hypothetical protein